jgi:hypothetical protein
LNERKTKQFIPNSCYLFVYLDKSYLLEDLSHQIERMTIKTKYIAESEDFIDLSNLDQIVQDTLGTEPAITGKPAGDRPVCRLSVRSGRIFNTGRFLPVSYRCFLIIFRQ